MCDTVESVNAKILEKLSMLKAALRISLEVAADIRAVTLSANVRMALESTVGTVSKRLADVAEIDQEYKLRAAIILEEYYRGEPAASKKYYIAVSSGGFIGTLGSAADSAAQAIAGLYQHARKVRVTAKLNEGRLDYAIETVRRTRTITVTLVGTKRNHEICKCGARMRPVAELSELHCDNCPCIKTVVGSVFRDDQYYSQEGQKTKHSGYDTARHLRFWLDRLQARGKQDFDPADIVKMEYVIKRDGYNVHMMTCRDVRTVLKDPYVSRTKLNDYAPLLLIKLGGRSPPQFTFQEMCSITTLFNTMMGLYDKVVQDGGNKPYYPYFLAWVFRHVFKNDPEKLRILDYIHLQSRETVTKNDMIYKEMCKVANDPDWTYEPVDPAAWL